MMTRQEIFDAAYKGLASQGFAQSKAAIGCAYRGADGMKCGVGHLIPDANYKEELEGLAADVYMVAEAAGLGERDYELAIDIQGAHDGNDIGFLVSPEQMKVRLERVAYRHGLTVPQVAA